MLEMQKQLGSFESSDNLPLLQHTLLNLQSNYNLLHKDIRGSLIRKDTTEHQACFGAHIILQANPDLFNEAEKKYYKEQGIIPSTTGKFKIGISNPANNVTQNFYSDRRPSLMKLCTEIPFSRGPLTKKNHNNLETPIIKNNGLITTITDKLNSTAEFTINSSERDHKFISTIEQVTESYIK